jgi:hypothetical protein
MKQALEDYFREVDEKAEKYAQQEEMSRRVEHLRSFNLGRLTQRLEKSRRETWVRMAWLMVGIVIGVALGRTYPSYLYPTLAHKFISKAAVMVRSAEKSGFSGFWRGWRA